MEFKRQQYLDELISYKDNGRIKIITGIRRCGKSYLLFKLYKDYLLGEGIKDDQIVELALDDYKNIKYRNPVELNDFIEEKIRDEKKYYVFIDEIQYTACIQNPYIDDPNEKITFVDVLLSLMHNQNLDVYVTGSNSKMLSKDVLSQFRDRGDEVHVYPLSFAEVCQNYSDRNIAWEEYKMFGGMPYIQSLDSFEKKSLYLKQLFDETYLRDVVERNGVKNDNQVLQILLDYVSSSIGSLTNPLKLSNRFKSELKLSVNSSTITNYLSYFEEAYVLYSAKRFDIKGAKYFSTPLKYYFADIGLRNARLNFRQIEDTHIMENVIYNDLVRRGFNVDVGIVEKRDVVNGKQVRVPLEVDFVINRGNLRYYIQSAFALQNQEKIDQKRQSLVRIGDSFKKIIIVKDSIVPHYDEYGIYYIGLLDFLTGNVFAKN